MADAQVVLEIGCLLANFVYSEVRLSVFLLCQMGFSFAGKAVYTAAWVAAASLFMELLGFSTQKWLTAGGLGTVLLTLAGREARSIFVQYFGILNLITVGQ